MSDQADALDGIARAIHALGNGDAGTTMGGLESLGMAIMKGNAEIATSISDLAEAVRDLADAVRGG